MYFLDEKKIIIFVHCAYIYDEYLHFTYTITSITTVTTAEKPRACYGLILRKNAMTINKQMKAS